MRNQPLSLDAWMDSLGRNENCPPDGIIDSNGLPSYGRYCFQTDTFVRYALKYGMSGAITDDGFQRQLAIKILHEPGGWRNWTTTVTTKIGKPPGDN